MPFQQDQKKKKGTAHEKPHAPQANTRTHVHTDSPTRPCPPLRLIIIPLLPPSPVRQSIGTRLSLLSVSVSVTLSPINPTDNDPAKTPPPSRPSSPWPVSRAPTTRGNVTFRPPPRRGGRAGNNNTLPREHQLLQSVGWGQCTPYPLSLSIYGVSIFDKVMGGAQVIIIIIAG